MPLKGLLKKNQPSSSIQDLIGKVQTYTSQLNTDQVIQAYEYSKKAHKGQKRRSGVPYITHPLAVAHILVDLQMDQESLITALLHDVVEDTQVSLEDVQKIFGPTVASLVDGVTKISKMNFKNTHHKQSENIRKMIVAMGKDVRVILVKLADRLHNLRTLEFMPTQKQSYIANETLDIYAPLASRLGMNEIKTEMEDLSFKYSSPETFKTLTSKMSQLHQDQEKYTEKVIHILKKELEKSNIKNYEVKGRSKNIYSIHRKMTKGNLTFEDIYDLIAFRICVDQVHECYEALGLIHNLWTPVSGRFKDFIAAPKSNNYQSLHTTVIGPQGHQIEIQIRTYDMHLTAERGIAAHWIYKSKDKNQDFKKRTLNQFNWLQDLVSWHQQSHDSDEFLENVKLDLFESEIYVFTPKGDIKEFPNGATPIDFAYSVHTDVGSKIVGAKVNGAQVPLKHKLQSGDMVEVMTSKNQSPSKDWLKICVTSRARSRIKNFFKEEERKRSLDIGKKIMEKECQKISLSEEEILSHKRLDSFLKDHGLNKVEELYIHLGFGKILFSQLHKYLYRTKIINPLPPATAPKKKPASSGSSPLVIEGADDIVVHLAKCCSPVSGDSIKAYISPKKGIVVHRSMCWELSEISSDRFIEVDWKGAESSRFSLSIFVTCEDKPGMLVKLSGVFDRFGLNISGIDVKERDELKAVIEFKTTVKDLNQVNQLIDHLNQIDHVVKVVRAGTNFSTEKK